MTADDVEGGFIHDACFSQRGREMKRVKLARGALLTILILYECDSPLGSTIGLAQH